MELKLCRSCAKLPTFICVQTMPISRSVQSQTKAVQDVIPQLPPDEWNNPSVFSTKTLTADWKQVSLLFANWAILMLFITQITETAFWDEWQTEWMWRRAAASSVRLRGDDGCAWGSMTKLTIYADSLAIHPLRSVTNQSKVRENTNSKSSKQLMHYAYVFKKSNLS